MSYFGRYFDGVTTPAPAAGTFDYSRSAATAQRLIARYGQLGALRTFANSGSELDPTLTPTDNEVRLFVDFEGWDASEISGTLIQMSDKKIYLSTDGILTAPTPADQIGVNGQFIDDVDAGHVFQGEMLTVVSVRALNPAGTVVFWLVAARG